MFFFFYNLVLTLLAPVAVPYWLLRSRAKGQPRRDLPERLGYLGGLTNQTPADSIWLHAVSVGEVLSAVPLLRRLRERFPASPLYVSTSTASGRKLAGQKLAGLADAVFAAPLEFPWCVARAFRALRPRLLIVVETEIWPNYFLQAERFGAETLLLNGRMSDRSAPRYARLRPFFAPILRRAGAILTQSEADRQRFLAAGAPPERTQVGGNVKYDFAPPKAGIADDLASFFQNAAPGSVVVAGSTREGEEELLARTFRAAAAGRRRALFVVAPRHPQRFDEAARAFDGLPLVRRSKLDAAAPPDLPAVLLLDTLGELAGLYPLADVVFMGGSLNGWGGHNVLEPALAKRPVIVGPAMQNFRRIADDLLAAGGLLQVDSVEELTAVLLRLLDDPAERRAVGENAFRLARSKRGASARGAAEAETLFQRALPRSPPRCGRQLALRIPAMLWGLASRLRLYLYAKGVRKARRLPAPVLSIGNLTAGGVGKTPAAAWLVERLAEAGIHAAVLTRGYGRDRPAAARIVRPGGGKIEPRSIGDEPALLAARFRRTAPHAVIGVGADRFAVGTRLLAEADAFVLDDGFQHLRLARDLDILLIDASRPLLGDCLLPLGRLREPLRGLRRADVILLTRAEPGRGYGALADAIRRWNASAPIFHSRTTASRLVHAEDRRELPLDSLRGKRVLAFCGIGNPDAFRRQLTALEYEIAAWRVFPDHHRYTPADRKRLAEAAAAVRADAWVATSKDLMNLDPPRGFAQPLYALEIELQIDKPAEFMALIAEALHRRQGGGPRPAL